MEGGKPSSMRPWLVVFTAGAFFCYSFIQMTLLGSAAMQEHFKEVLQLGTPDAFGNFAGTFLYGTVLLLIPAGVLLDKVSVRQLVLFSLAVVVLCVFGLAYAASVHAAMAMRFIQGGAHCVAFMAPFRLAPRWFPSGKLALVAGLLVTFAVFGGWISGAPMLGLVAAVGARGAMLSMGAAGCALLVLSAALLRDFPDGAPARGVEAERVPLGAGLAMAARNRQNWLAGLYIGLLNLSVLLLGAVWGTTYLKIVNPRFSEAVSTAIIGMIFIGTMIGSPLGGLISDRIRSRRIAMIGGATLSLLVMLLIILPPSDGAVMFYALFLLLGIITASQSIGYAVIAESNDDKVLGTANGLSAVVLMGMGAIGQPLFGQLVTLFGGGEGASAESIHAAFRQAIWVMPVAFIGAAVCAAALRETFRKDS